VFPREILHSRSFLAELQVGLPVLRERPALLVWPTKDVAFRTAERERWEAVFPDHRTVMLEGASHYIQEEAPEEIVRAIGDWMPGGR
jgi:haloalkane dehalogenase